MVGKKIIKTKIQPIKTYFFRYLQLSNSIWVKPKQQKQKQNKKRKNSRLQTLFFSSIFSATKRSSRKLLNKIWFAIITDFKFKRRSDIYIYWLRKQQKHPFIETHICYRCTWVCVYTIWGWKMQIETLAGTAVGRPQEEMERGSLEGFISCELR